MMKHEAMPLTFLVTVAGVYCGINEVAPSVVESVERAARAVDNVLGEIAESQPRNRYAPSAIEVADSEAIIST